MGLSNQSTRALRELALTTLAGAAPGLKIPGVDEAILPTLEAVLIGWRPLATGAQASSRVAEHTVSQLARLYATRDRHPDNPRNDPRRGLPAAERALAWPPDEREARFGPLLRAGAEALLSERVNAAFDERIARWERAFLIEGIAAFQAEERRRQQALGRIGRALGVGIDLLGLGADWSAGFFSERALAALEETAHRLESSPALHEILVQLGRIEAAEAAIGREPAPAVRLRAAGRSELRGVTLSGDLARLTPAALAGLGAAETEGATLLGLVENRLMSWDLGGPTTELSAVRSPSVHRGGPIVVCIDTSASMDGAAESLAKAVALAALRQALRQRRACQLVSFSSATDWRQIEATNLPEILPEILDFLLGSFRGGTEPGAALTRLAASRPARADVLLISDGRFEAEGLAAGARALRSVGARCFGLLIGPDERAPAFASLDAVWGADPAGVVRCVRAPSGP